MKLNNIKKLISKIQIKNVKISILNFHIED